MYRSGQELDHVAALGVLSLLSAKELEEILNDENEYRLDDIIKDVKQLKDLETDKEMILASNKSLAEFNLSKEPELCAGKISVQELSQTGEELCKRIDQKISKIKEKSDRTSLETNLALLQASAAETEDHSEEIAEKLLANDIDVEEFLVRFVEVRKLMHLRKVKSDKMQEIINKKKQVPPRSSFHQPPAVPIYQNAPPTQPPPYPVRMQMPTAQFWS